ncbi:MAG: tripartite tricarboxylate transporter substrate binding protein, partial [Pseudomonadota bacterium]
MNPRKLMLFQVVAALCCVAVLFTINTAFAQEVYPTRPIKLLVPFSPGGTTDVFARKYAERMSRELGQQMYAENKVGASGAIAAAEAARSNPDGYTLFFATSSQLALLPLMGNVNYDVEKDFVYIALVGKVPLLISVNADFPAKSLSELVAILKANPDKYSFGHSGIGGPPHLGGELFKKLAGVDLLSVPYKGSAPALYDAIAGINPVFIDSFVTILPQHRAGKMRILAILSEKRSQIAPEIPTSEEAGIPGLISGSFQVVTAPVKIPRNVLSVLENATSRIMRDSSFQKELIGLFFDPVTDSTPE